MSKQNSEKTHLKSKTAGYHCLKKKIKNQLFTILKPSEHTILKYLYQLILRTKSKKHKFLNWPRCHFRSAMIKFYILGKFINLWIGWVILAVFLTFQPYFSGFSSAVSPNSRQKLKLSTIYTTASIKIRKICTCQKMHFLTIKNCFLKYITVLGKG